MGRAGSRRLGFDEHRLVKRLDWLLRFLSLKNSALRLLGRRHACLFWQLVLRRGHETLLIFLGRVGWNVRVARRLISRSLRSLSVELTRTLLSGTLTLLFGERRSVGIFLSRSISSVSGFRSRFGVVLVSGFRSGSLSIVTSLILGRSGGVLPGFR